MNKCIWILNLESRVHPRVTPETTCMGGTRFLRLRVFLTHTTHTHTHLPHPFWVNSFCPWDMRLSWHVQNWNLYSDYHSQDQRLNDFLQIRTSLDVSAPGPSHWYQIEYVTFGLLYVMLRFSTRKVYRIVPGFATDCPCGVWCRGLTHFPLVCWFTFWKSSLNW